MARINSIDAYVRFVKTANYNIVPREFFRNCNRMVLNMPEANLFEMMDMIRVHNGFNIRGDKLAEYGVATLHNNADVFALLQHRNMRNGKDYISRQVAGVAPNDELDHIQYFLAKNTFKDCLLKSTTENVHRKNYIIMEDLWALFDDIVTYRIQMENLSLRRELRESEERREHPDRQISKMHKESEAHRISRDEDIDHSDEVDHY